MARTLPPGLVELPHGTFAANVQPDAFDERDLEYRPRLQALAPVVDTRPDDRHVLEQTGNSCTGHAVAGMVNAVLAAQGDATHVSPYMLYRLARRYDEFEGEADEGSSLRGALKGWYHHGVLPDTEWPRLTMRPEPDIDSDFSLMELAQRRPLGAFYRVNTARLDDLQSAVNELSAIVASAAVHDGWVEPTRLRLEDTEMFLIERRPGARQLGGHAFCIVGYNEVGFLVQNSWGRRWGKKGFATLPYNDWLESGYDAWVARPGVPSIVSQRPHTHPVVVSGRAMAEGPGPDIPRLTRHVVNLGNNGRLSRGGRFVSSPRQVDGIFTHMAAYHRLWESRHPARGRPKRRVLLYAHGGLNSEETGLTIAHRQLNWWLNNEVYPITFAWQSGAVETLLNQVGDIAGDATPAGGIGFTLVEQFDRLVERVARSRLRWVWDEMKENATGASTAMSARRTPSWPPSSAKAWADMADLPGASLTVSRLKAYVDEHDGKDVEVHLVGHSAGSIFLTGVLDRLAEVAVPVETLTYLAPAIRTDTWVQKVLPRLRSGHVRRFATFGLSADRELDDVCGAGGVDVYQKSLLYLVSRALERGRRDQEVPLLGMRVHQDREVRGTSLADVATEDGVDVVWAPSQSPSTSRSDSTSHGGFDDDGPTMTSVLLRVLGATKPVEVNNYRPHAPLTGPGPAELPASDVATVTAEARPTGSVPVTRTRPAPAAPGAAVPTSEGRMPEEREAPESSSPELRALVRKGWVVVDD